MSRKQNLPNSLADFDIGDPFADMVEQGGTSSLSSVAVHSVSQGEVDPHRFPSLNSSETSDIRRQLNTIEQIENS
jgi:hypothetical protein